MTQIWTERTIEIAAAHGVTISSELADAILADRQLDLGSQTPPDRKLHRFFALVAQTVPKETAA